MKEFADTRIEVVKPFRVEFYGLSKDIKPNIYLVSFVWQNDDPYAVTEGFKEYITTISFDTLLDNIIKKEEVGYIVNFASFDEDTKTLNDLDIIRQDMMLDKLINAYTKQQGLDEHEKDSELKWYDQRAGRVRIITRTVQELDLVEV